MSTYYLKNQLMIHQLESLHEYELIIVNVRLEYKTFRKSLFFLSENQYLRLEIA